MGQESNPTVVGKDRDDIRGSSQQVIALLIIIWRDKLLAFNHFTGGITLEYLLEFQNDNMENPEKESAFVSSRTLGKPYLWMVGKSRSHC